MVERDDVRIFGLGFSRQRFVAPVYPGWARVAYAASGAGIVRSRALVALIDARRGVGLGDEAGVEIEPVGSLDLRIVYARPFEVSPGCVAITPLARALVERAVRLGRLDPQKARDARVQAVLVDELRHLERLAGGFALALPSDPRGAVAAEICARDASSPLRSAQELAIACECGARTLERIFMRETGGGVVAWQRRLRLVAAAAAIANGCGVTEAGFDAGYGDTSAFVTAFRRAFGRSPGRFARETGA